MRKGLKIRGHSSCWEQNGESYPRGYTAAGFVTGGMPTPLKEELRMKLSLSLLRTHWGSHFLTHFPPPHANLQQNSLYYVPPPSKACLPLSPRFSQSSSRVKWRFILFPKPHPTCVPWHSLYLDWPLPSFLLKPLPLCECCLPNPSGSYGAALQ